MTALFVDDSNSRLSTLDGSLQRVTHGHTYRLIEARERVQLQIPHCDGNVADGGLVTERLMLLRFDRIFLSDEMLFFALMSEATTEVNEKQIL